MIDGTYTKKYSELAEWMETVNFGTFDLTVDCDKETDISNLGVLINKDKVFINLTPINVTASITNIDNIFLNCTSLKRIDLKAFNDVVSMSNTFKGCSSLEYINIENPYIPRIKSSYTYKGCTKLNTIRLRTINDMKAKAQLIDNAPITSFPANQITTWDMLEAKTSKYIFYRTK